MVQQRDIAAIVFVYVLFAAVWIWGLADQGGQFATMEGEHGWSALTGGLAFLCSSSLLLYILIFWVCSLRNKARQKEYENAELLKFLIQHASDSLVILNADGSQRYVSPAAEKITGYPAAELEGKNLEGIIHPDDLEQIKKAWNAAVADPENTVAVEYRHMHKDGGWIYSEAVAQSFFHDPAINGMLATVRDTTARKVAEDTLRRQGALLQAMVRNIPFDFWARDINERVIIQSEESIKLWGDLQADPTAQETIPRQTQRSWQKNNAQVFEGKIIAHDCSLLSKDGERREYHSVVAPIRDGNEILGIMGLNLDITEERIAREALKESEERLHLVMEGSQLGYWDWNIESGEVRRNRRWAEMLGYTQKEIEDNVRQWTDLHHPDDRAPAWESIEHHLQGKTPAHRMEYRMLAKDGKYRWILDQASVTKRDNTGAPLRMSGTHTDITEYKKKEAEREKLREQLAQAQKMESIGRLAGGVAHDFNNMLSVILGYTEMCMAQISPEHPLREKLQEIERAGQHSATITRQLLAFARKQTNTPRVLDLNETVEGMLRMLRRLIGENITLNWAPSNHLKQVEIDPSQVDQILANLCVNARDAITGAGKIEISTANVVLKAGALGSKMSCAPGEYVHLAFSDNGCGMEKETLAHLFEPFFTTKDVGKGTGLGLATVYGIVQQNHGCIQVASTLNQGTRFDVYFPASESTPDNRYEELEVLACEHGKATILLVEDERAILEMATLMLESMGYFVLAVGSAREALEVARSFSGEIDLLITDVIMPEMNGRELAQQLSGLRPAMRHLFMSGYTADVIASHGMFDDETHFIHKPFSKKDFEEKVIKVLADS